MARARREQGLDGGGPGGRPQVVLRSNGEGEVRFRDGCTVTYRRNGDRDRASDSCTRDQRRDADEAMARARREQGHGGGGGDGGWKGFTSAPRVTILDTGLGLATYPDGCRVDYDLRGDRTKASRNCSADQVNRADEAMARLRAERRGSQTASAAQYSVTAAGSTMTGAGGAAAATAVAPATSWRRPTGPWRNTGASTA